MGKAVCGYVSPDGRQIAFNSVHEGSRQVYFFDIK
ncbi:MAG: PD40 domain-containing protein [Kiritimatiellae bacterium]|nr:PD40 domain-containing protein [Kiritimatiellia bacterium]